MQPRSLLLILIITICLMFVILGIRTYHFKGASKTVTNSSLQNKKDPADKNIHSYETVLEKCFEDLEIPKSQIKSNFFPEDSLVELKIAVPRGKPTEWIIWFISSSLSPAGFKLTDSKFESEIKGANLQLTPLKKNLPKLNIRIVRSSSFFSQTAKMAILVEDFGFEANETTVGFLSFPEPLSVSMVSSRRLSTWTAQIANEYKKEILIMLPMEPLPKSFSRYDQTQIKLHFTEDKIKTIIKEATDAIPSFAGFCNFYGERILQDSRVMQIVITEVQKHHGYFLITENVKKSTAESMVKKMKIPFEKIDYTINTNKSVASIQDSLRYYAILAQNTGKVLIRGRATNSFFTALNNTLPQLKQNGIRLVYISDILNHPAER